MSPKTAARPAPSSTVDEAEEALAAARAQLASLRERVAGGDMSITAQEVAEAGDAVDLAELQVEGIREHERRRRDAERLERVEAVRRSLSDGRLVATAAEIVDLYDAAVEAMARMGRLKVQFEDELAESLAVLADAGRDGVLPAGVGLLGNRRGDFVYEVKAVRVDGVRWTPEPGSNLRLLGQAARDAVERMPRRKADGGAGSDGGDNWTKPEALGRKDDPAIARFRQLSERAAHGEEVGG